MTTEMELKQCRFRQSFRFSGALKRELPERNLQTFGFKLSLPKSNYKVIRSGSANLKTEN